MAADELIRCARCGFIAEDASNLTGWAVLTLHIQKPGVSLQTRHVCPDCVNMILELAKMSRG